MYQLRPEQQKLSCWRSCQPLMVGFMPWTSGASYSFLYQGNHVCVAILACGEFKVHQANLMRTCCKNGPTLRGGGTEDIKMSWVAVACFWWLRCIDKISAKVIKALDAAWRDYLLDPELYYAHLYSTAVAQRGQLSIKVRVQCQEYLQRSGNRTSNDWVRYSVIITQAGKNVYSCTINAWKL